MFVMQLQPHHPMERGTQKWGEKTSTGNRLKSFSGELFADCLRRAPDAHGNAQWCAGQRMYPAADERCIASFSLRAFL
jgi:hypothetical protein